MYKKSKFLYILFRLFKYSIYFCVCKIKNYEVIRYPNITA